MSNFNNIEYRNYDDYEEKPPIIRKLRIVENNDNEKEKNNENENENEYLKEKDNDHGCDKPRKNIYNSASLTSVDLNSTIKYGLKKPENRFYDSLTNTSFNDINEFNQVNNIRFSGKKENLIMEVEDTKNILKHNLHKVYDRHDKLDALQEQTETLLDGSNKFNQTSKYLKRKMYINYICHMVSVALTIVIITTFIVILTKK